MMTDAEDGLDIGGTSYRLLSGVAHAASYGLVQMIERTDRSTEPGVSTGRVRQSSATAAAHFLPVPLAFVLGAQRVIEDYGWDATGWHEPVLAALQRWRDHAQSSLSN
jgi:hypothetical protein